MKLSYDAYNPASNHSPIIFLHGLADWRLSWRKVAQEIATKTNRQAYAPDARNHGTSPRSADMDYDVLTQDLVDFMDDLRIKSAVIVGHSMGGRTAINFALKHPDRTDALVVEDMTPRNIQSGSGSFVFQLISAVTDILKNIPSELSLEEAKEYLKDFLISFGGERFLDVAKVKKVFDAGIIPITKTGGSFMPMADMDALLTLLRKNALVQNLPDSGLRYSGDSMFLYGSKPFFNLLKDASIKKLFPKAKVRKIDGSSHYIHIDNSDVFVQEVSNFILSRHNHPSKI